MRAVSGMLVTWFVAVPLANAAGWADLTGVNAQGDSFSLVPTFVDEPGHQPTGDAFASFAIRVRPVDADPEDGGQEFLQEPCVLALDPVDGSPMFLGCGDAAKSPLRGTRYLAHPNPDPDNCDWSHRFTCVQGCSDDVPRQLEQGFWECGEPPE